MTQKENGKTWTTPALMVHGTVAEITGDPITKQGVAGDVLIIGEQTIPIPGSRVVG